ANGLDVASTVRMLMTRADRRAGGPPSPPERADELWSRLHGVFLQSGATDTLARIVVFEQRVRALVQGLDELAEIAKQCGESTVYRAAVGFRDRMRTYPQLHAIDK